MITSDDDDDEMKQALIHTRDVPQKFSIFSHYLASISRKVRSNLFLLQNNVLFILISSIEQDGLDGWQKANNAYSSGPSSSM